MHFDAEPHLWQEGRRGPTRDQDDTDCLKAGDLIIVRVEEAPPPT